jgi:hypothetical protein
MGTWERIVEHFLARVDGPLHFRFIFQPLMGTIFAVIDGLKDAKNGKPAYFWSLLWHSGHRQELLKDGWKHVGKIFIIALILDVIYQWKYHPRIYPGELLIVSFILAIVPYLLLRGPINRIAQIWRKP